MNKKFNQKILILSFLLIIFFITPTFADSLDCSKCSINQQCSCELKLDGGVCTSGLWIVLNSEGNPLQFPVIVGIPPAKVSFTPTGTGKIKIMGFCFSTPMPIILKKEIEITKSFLQCPATCKIGDSCTCTVTNCTDGLYVMINKINNPVDYNTYPYLSNIKTDPYTNTFKPKENGTVGIVAVCFSPLPPKSATADIIIGGEDSKCHVPHEDPSWLPQNNDYEIKVLEKGCTDSCGTEYKIEIRRGINCGKQLWIWVSPNVSPLEISKCYLVMIRTGGCGYTITSRLQNEVTCPECDKCHTHEDLVWMDGNHKLKIIQKGCTANNGCSEGGSTASTEYLVEIRDKNNCGKQLWLWLDNTMTQNQPVVGKCYEAYIMKYANNCNAYVIRYLQHEITCPDCSATCGDLNGVCCDSGQTCIGTEISGTYDCLGYPCCNGYCRFTTSTIIADHTTINKFDSIPNSWIEKAKETFRISYGHTSHGSQIISGMNILKEKSSLYSFNTDGGINILSLHDRTPSGDLGNPDRTTWESRTKDMLENSNNNRNLVMWSWCGQADTSESNMQIYLDLMNQLELDYPDITFIYMTGHLTGTGENGNLNQRNNQIRDFCKTNNKILFDFADIESYNPDGSYFLDKNANDACSYNGGNWADEWCAANPSSDMCSTCSCAHSKPLNCNMKARAFWWMMARLAGWSGE